ncbi:hypothetical protein EB118_03095 [bacterium]|nr:hypothetical protein [bacterium]NDC93951.1 hypothetical protein [bacterium]NDD83446.1 hypothetical protein [bacterium]NDG29071.1 hypothetical protein [bacterium]
MDVEVIKSELSKTLGDFLNELELAFEYINNTSDIRNYIKENETTLFETLHSELAPFDKDITLVSTKQRAKLDFMENIVLFGGRLEFHKFAQENKSTKRTLVNYLYNILTLCVLHKTTCDGSLDLENLGDTLSNFITSMTQSIDTTTQSIETSSSRPKRRVKRSSGEDLFSKLFENDSILSIAGDLTREIEKEKVDPMAMLNSLLTGKSNQKVDHLIKNLTNNIEQKINSGEIDKTKLEEQANNILSTVQSSDLFASVLKGQVPRGNRG